MTDVRGKRVLVVGLARSGRAAARCLQRRGAEVTVTDLRPPWEVQVDIAELLAGKIGMELGIHRTETFLRQDMIVVSPGVPPDLPELEAARRRSIPVVPEVEAASWFLEAQLAGITGSNGKTTTTALLGEMLKASGFRTFVGGNIGVPLISAVDQIPKDGIAVTELSSFQLETVQSLRPRVSVLLNLTPNHLDRHPSFEAYVRAKQQIFRNQTAEDFAVLNADDPLVMRLAPEIAARKIFFSRTRSLPDGVMVSNGHILYRAGNLERVLMATKEVALRGAFNLENVLAAAAAACVLGADFEALRQAVRKFQGVEHRLEFVREIRGVEFYNDSKATSVDAAAKALSAFERGVHLILGGKDKGAPYAPLVPLLKERVRRAYLMGAAAERIAREIQGAVELDHAGDLETAVRRAFDRAAPGDVILLSPACSSFDQFQDYEHRGRTFKELVVLLAREAATVELETRKREAVARLASPVPATPSAGPLLEKPAGAGAVAADAPLVEHIAEAVPLPPLQAAITEFPATGSELPREEAVAGSIERPDAQPEAVAAGTPQELRNDQSSTPEIIATEPLLMEPLTDEIEERADQASAAQPQSLEPIPGGGEHVPPVPVVTYPELLYVYEVGAEESAPAEIDSSPPLLGEDTDSYITVDAESLETAEDEALPFEARVGGTADTRGSTKGGESPQGGPAESDAETPGNSGEGQERLPGI
jgi:UDP-N-acetylmuramoylalanine--D-glutamate ligase